MKAAIRNVGDSNEKYRWALLSIFLIGLPDYHKPYPSPLLKPYQIDQVLDVLHQEGLL